MGREMTLWRGGVANTWGQVGSDSRRSRKARGREQRTGLASKAGCCHARKLGWLVGPAAAARMLG